MFVTIFERNMPWFSPGLLVPFLLFLPHGCHGKFHGAPFGIAPWPPPHHRARSALRRSRCGPWQSSSIRTPRGSCRSACRPGDWDCVWDVYVVHVHMDIIYIYMCDYMVNIHDCCHELLSCLTVIICVHKNHSMVTM